MSLPAAFPAKTESYDSRYETLDLWPTDTLLEALLESQLGAVSAIKAAVPDLEQAITAALPRLQRGGRLFYVGAGTSGRIGLQDGVELIPTYGWPEERLVLLLAGGDAALFQPVEGAEDDEAAARDAILTHKAGPDDVVIGVAASGGTPYTCAALACAKEAGSLTIGLSCSPNARLLHTADVGVLIATGPEVVAGSTRMKAGTAQKVTLNMLSTALMIRLGHTWRGQMVDMRIVNAKLVKRAHRMVQHLAGCSEAEAINALEQAQGSIKLAILVCFGFSPQEGRTVLAQHNGNLRAVLPTVHTQTL